MASRTGGAPGQLASASSHFYRRTSFTTALLAALLPGTALAQNPADVEQIVVTARRQAESLERVPTAVTAVTAQQLEQQVIVSQTDLQTAVPGLTLRETQGSNSLTYSLRGQTVDNFTGSATAVVPYFNDVQLSTGGASTFFDLDSIQVLKGPQGTLFGRNATGGAVLFTATPPQDEFGGYVKYRTGDYDLQEGLGALNIPIVPDKVILRIATDIVSRDGYQQNLFNGEELGAIDRQSGRLSLLLRPVDKLQNTLVLEADHSGGNSTANRLNGVNSCGATNGGFALNCTAALLFSPEADLVYGPGTWAAYLAAHPNGNPAGIAAYLAQNAPKLGFYQADEASWVYHQEQDYLLTNTTSYDLTPDMQVKNIFGASQSDTRDQGSSVGAPYLVFASENLDTGERGNHTTQFNYSDELQLTGKAQSLNYIFGGYYQKQDSNTVFPQVYFDLSPLGPPSSVDNHFGITDQTEALYGQATYDLAAIGLKDFSFTAGYRYSWEQFSMSQLAGGIFPSGTQDVTFSNPSWTLGLSYQAMDDLLLYVQGRRSWRSGGLNGTAPPLTVGAEGGGNLFQPEFTRDVEIGAKFGGHLFDRPTRANLALFDQWIDNVQRAEFPVPPGRQQSIAVTINVPAAEVTGLEFDASMKPIGWLDIGVSGALTDARFVQGENSAQIFGQLYVFGPYADTPKASGSLYATVTLPAPETWGRMDLRTDVYGQTGTYFSNNNNTITPNTRIGGYGLVNLRYDWTSIAGSDFSFAAYVKNLTDKEYYTGGFALDASLGVSSLAIGTPRMFGVELAYDF
jgi:iron complex outermembrane recepter protein